MAELQRGRASQRDRIGSQGLSLTRVDRPFYVCSLMEEVLYLEKAYSVIRVVDKV